MGEEIFLPYWQNLSPKKIKRSKSHPNKIKTERDDSLVCRFPVNLSKPVNQMVHTRTEATVNLESSTGLF